MDNDWLQNVKVGDEVASSGNFGTPSILKVTRITKTHIVTGQQRWRKSDGLLVGAHSYYRRIQPLTAEIREKIERAHLLRWLTDFEDRAVRNPKETPIEILRAVKSTVERLTDSDK